MATLGNIKNEKNENNKQTKYCCDCCDFITCKLTDYNRHLLTQKHIRNQKNEKNEKNEKKLYACENCNKEYCDKSGLWKHKKNCHTKENHYKACEEDEELDISTKQLILMLFKQNNELQQSLIEMSKQTTSSINNIGNTNMNHSNNKTFNLQFFLNETCKDAMNIKEFVDSVQLELCDLENVGKSGYIEGISNIIIKNLNALEMEKRPIHCTDNKREVIYIKDEDKWEKEEDNKPKLKKLIKAIAHKNICMFKKFREKYPDCDNGESKKSSVFNTIVYESMGGKGDDEAVKDNKIIHKISKHVGIDKVHLTTF
jgi:hypothetical protein